MAKDSGNKYSRGVQGGEVQRRTMRAIAGSGKHAGRAIVRREEQVRVELLAEHGLRAATRSQAVKPRRAAVGGQEHLPVRRHGRPTVDRRAIFDRAHAQARSGGPHLRIAVLRRRQHLRAFGREDSGRHGEVVALQVSQASAGLGAPNPRGEVIRGSDDTQAIRGEGRRKHAADVPPEGLQAIARACVPQLRGVVARGGQDLRPVGGKGRRGDAVGVPLQCEEARAGVRAPQLRGAIIGSSDDHGARGNFRRELGVVD
mmetsp:Transcript_99894/g.287037  ORF Transcript_99894/g.287037 Transcript_99894/m.287037 type:complete len:258 (-) Transcript_99894:412-1185(-)